MAESKKVNGRFLPTGVNKIDTYLRNGLSTQSVTVIGGSLGSGKTTLAVAIGAHVESLGYKVLHIVREEYTNAVGEKYKAVKTGEVCNRLSGVDLHTGDVKVDNVYITYLNFDETVSEVVSSIVKNNNLDLVIVENLGVPSVEEVDKLRSLAQDHDLAVLGTSLLSRVSLSGNLNDFDRNIVAKADLVININRKFVPALEPKVTTTISINKFRYRPAKGAPSTFEVNFDGAHVRIN